MILDVFHGMTDGTGAYEILRTLLYYYCSERYQAAPGGEGIRLTGDEIPMEEWADPVRDADLPAPQSLRPCFGFFLLTTIPASGIVRL